MLRAAFANGRGKSSKRDLSFVANAPGVKNTLVAGSANFLLEAPILLRNPLSLEHATRGDQFFAAEINGRPCVAFRFKNCPLHVIELIADFHISSEFDLQPGAYANISVPYSQPSISAKFVWEIIWGRRRNYYTEDEYVEAWDKLRWIYKLSCQ